MSKKSAIVATVGFFIVGLIQWMHSLPRAGWIDVPPPEVGAGTVPLALILGVVGILAFLQEEALDSIVFLGLTALTLSHHAAHWLAIPPPPAAAVSWTALIWTVFFFYVWWGNRRTGGTRGLFLLGLWLTLLAGTINYWSSGAHAIGVIGGYLGLATGLMALLTSAKAASSHSTV